MTLATTDPVDSIFLIISNIFLFVSAILALGFVLLYQLLAKWEESPWGWNIILTNVALFFVLTLGVGATLFGYDFPGRQIIRSAVFLGVGVTLTHHIYLLVKTQLGKRLIIKTKHDSTKEEGTDVH